MVILKFRGDCRASLRLTDRQAGFTRNDGGEGLSGHNFINEKRCFTNNHINQ